MISISVIIFNTVLRNVDGNVNWKTTNFILVKLMIYNVLNLLGMHKLKQIITIQIALVG